MNVCPLTPTVQSMNLLGPAAFPIGGIKGSGWGRNNSQFGIEEFIQLKTISLNMENVSGSFGTG